ncbi:HMA2 domain-containing protein [Immundisolibacter sp.]|uniref:HMA2 domain-containing protein n=1 Tax=Immundisolibacter sp. TaxID=1934948 RepID=UPI00260643DA|nr:hypothetical protein [Immundisolibacter sp.]MDD3652488.1 hypothetical protein [Immundisolibacter sp.]
MPSTAELIAVRELLRRAGIDIAHYAPGRLRLRVARIKTDASFATRLKDRLAGVPGVLHLELRPLTGSVLIEFTADALNAAPAREALIDALTALFPGLDGARLDRFLATL